LPGHRQAIVSSDFSPDGRWLISGAADTTLQVWEVAEPRQALEQSSPAEVRRRLNLVLGRLERPVTAPERLRELRAVAVLESVGGPDARAVLEKLAAGSAGARLTEEVKAALARLRPR
jgi:hypothetical protein